MRHSRWAWQHHSRWTCMTLRTGLFSPVHRQYILISPRNCLHKYAAATGDAIGETHRRRSIRTRVLHKTRAQVSPHRAPAKRICQSALCSSRCLPFPGPSGQGCRLPRPASGKTTRFSDFQRTGLSPWGARRVISECHFAVQLNNFIPVALSYSVAAFLT